MMKFDIVVQIRNFIDINTHVNTIKGNHREALR